MNEFNHEQQNDQVSASGNESQAPKQENVYTVGGGYGQQTVSPTSDSEQDAPRAADPGPQNPQNTQPPQTGYTAPSGNSYSYSSNPPPYYGQPGGYYASYTPPRPPKKKSKAGLVALAVIGCVLVSLLMGVGGAALTWSIMSGQDETYDDVINEFPCWPT